MDALDGLDGPPPAVSDPRLAVQPAPTGYGYPCPYSAHAATHHSPGTHIAAGHSPVVTDQTVC